MLKNKVTLYAFAIPCFTSLIFSMPILADQYHYNNILIGNRAAGLAGSYVAVSDDPSGLYYNPSGVVYASSGNITANMNAYNIARTTYVGALKKSTGESVDWVRTSSALVPNFFGITQPLGAGTVGFSYAITDSVLEDQGQTFNDITQNGTQYTINFNNQDITNNVGPSYAIKVSNEFSIGLTLYGYFRTQERIFNQIFQLPIEDSNLTSPAFLIENQYLSRREIGIKPIFGVTYTPFNRFSFGMALSQVFLLSSTIDEQKSSALNICLDGNVRERCPTDEATSFSLTQQTISKKRSFPWQINVGGAYFHSNRLMLTGNAWIYEAMNGTNRPLVNVAGGIEYYFSGKMAIRMGAYTNLANTPKLQAGVINVANEYLNIVGVTSSITFFTRSSAISVGAAGSYGKGEAQVSGINIQQVEYVGMSVFLSASNSF